MYCHFDIQPSSHNPDYLPVISGILAVVTPIINFCCTKNCIAEHFIALYPPFRKILACGEATVASAVPSHSRGPLLGFPFSDPMFAVLFLTWLRATVQH